MAEDGAPLAFLNEFESPHSRRTKTIVSYRSSQMYASSDYRRERSVADNTTTERIDRCCKTKTVEFTRQNSAANASERATEDPKALKRDS